MDLQEIVNGLEIPEDPRVLVGLGTADDAGIYHLSDEHNLVQTVDFITPPLDDPYLYGKIAACNSLSDVYAMGGRPLTVLNICCFPSAVDKAQLHRILQGGLDVTRAAGAALLGGHSVRDDELKYGLSVTGIVRKADIVRNSTARPGDLLVLTKPVGTGVIITGTRKGHLPPDGPLLRAAENMATLNLHAARRMVELGASAATDITGFGLAGHALEMARGSRVAIRFWADRLPHYPESIDMIAHGVRTGLTLPNLAAVAAHFRPADDVPETVRGLYLDPQTSGGLLISMAAERAQRLIDLLREDGVREAAIIGEVLDSPDPYIAIERTH